MFTIVKQTHIQSTQIILKQMFMALTERMLTLVSLHTVTELVTSDTNNIADVQYFPVMEASRIAVVLQRTSLSVLVSRKCFCEFLY